MRLRRRFTGESALEFSGGYVKTFWTGWQFGTGTLNQVTRTAKVLADTQAGIAELSVSTSYQHETATDVPAHVAFRVTEGARTIVDEATIDEKCFLDVTFSLEHVGVATSIFEVFSDTGESITLELGNTEAKLTMFDEVIPVTNYLAMLSTVSSAGSTSRTLRYSLYAKNTEYHVEGTRCFAVIRAVLSDNTNVFNASKSCALFFKQNWQYESRLQTRS